MPTLPMRTAFSQFGAVVLALLALGAATACGDETAAQGGGGAGGATGGGEPALEVIVVDRDGGLEGVTVAADLADGTRLERVSDTDGATRFTIDVEQLTGLIAHRDGYTFAAMTPAAVAEVLEAGEPVTLTVVPVPPPVGVANAGTVDVTGMFLGRVAGANAAVSTTAARGIVDLPPTQSSYTLPVPMGQPFTVVGFQYSTISSDARGFEEEHQGWTLMEHPAISDATTIDLDFGMSIAPIVVSGSIGAPANARLREEAWLNVLVFAGAPTEHVGTPPGNAWVGFASTTAPLDGDTGYSFVIDYVETPGVNVFTHYSLHVPTDDAGNDWLVFAYVDGPPQEAPDIAFLTPPERITPARGSGIAGPPHAWSTPISWTVDEADEGLIQVVYTTGNTIGVSTIGVIDVAAGDRSATLGALPSTSTTLSGGAVIWGHVSVYASTDADPELELVSAGGAFTVQDPFGP